MTTTSVRQQMVDYLLRYQDLFYQLQNITDYLPVGEVTDLAIIDEVDEDPTNFFGFDFTGDYRATMLFFTGSSTYFPGILIGHHEFEMNADKLPIYLMDSERELTDKVELVGNFKTYMTKLYDHVLSNDNPELQPVLQQAKHELHVFSDELIFYFDNLTFDMIQV